MLEPSFEAQLTARTGAALPRLAPELNSARSAARTVATMPPLRDAAVQREIRLHAALYRAAMHQAGLGPSRWYVLEPMASATIEPYALEPREFQLRVLAELDRLAKGVAWTTDDVASDFPRASGETLFPGTRHPAVRLVIRIQSRDERAATVQAEVGAQSPDASTPPGRATLFWDGQEWMISKRGRLVQ